MEGLDIAEARAARSGQLATMRAGLVDPGGARSRISAAVGRELKPAQVAAVLDALMQREPDALVPRVRALCAAAAPAEYVVRTRPACRYDWVTLTWDGAGVFVPLAQGTGFFTAPMSTTKSSALTNNTGANGQLSSDESFLFSDIRYGIRVSVPPATFNGDIAARLLSGTLRAIAVQVQIGRQNVDAGMPPLWHLTGMGPYVVGVGDTTAVDGANSASVAQNGCCPWVFPEPLEVPSGLTFTLPLQADSALMPSGADFIDAQVEVGVDLRGRSAHTVTG